MKDKYFIIKSFITNKYYYVNLLVDDYGYRIVIGGVKKRCIEITIDTTENVGIIQIINFDKKCAYFSDLERGNEMIDLIKCSLYFCILKFPNIKKYDLTDNSTIICKNGKNISLSILYFIKYNKTWYEKHFNAIPFNKDDIKNRKKNITKILNKTIKLSLVEFINKYYKEINNDLFLQKIKKSYYENIKLKNFINLFLNDDCIYYQRLFNVYFENKPTNNFKNTNWIIKKKYIEKYDVKINIINTHKLKQNTDLEKLHNNLNKIDYSIVKGVV